MFSQNKNKNLLNKGDYEKIIEVLENHTPRPGGGFFASGLMKVFTSSANSPDELKQELNELRRQHEEEAKNEQEKITVLTAKVIEQKNAYFS